MDGGFGGEQFGHGGLVLVGRALVFEPGGLVDEQFGGFMFGDHVGDLRLDHLVGADLFAELGPFVGVADGGLDGAAADAEGAGGAADAGVVELPHADLEPLADFAEDGIFRNLGLTEGDFAGGGAVEAEFGFDGGGDDAGVAFEVDDEAGHAFVAFAFVGHGVDEAPVADVGVGDPHFLAVQFPVVAAVGGGGAHAGDVGAGVRFGDGEEAERFGADPGGDEALFLPGGAEFVDGDGGADVLHVERQA